MVKILVTGAGFIGKNLIKTLSKTPNIDHVYYTTHRSLQYGSQFLHSRNLLDTSFYCDLTYEQDVKEIFRWCQPDVIFHLAGYPRVSGDERKIMQANVDTTHLILQNCPEKCKFVLASTLIVHGDKNCPISDFDIPEKPTSIYGISKLTAEKLVWKYHNDGKIVGKVLRLVATVGSGLTHGLLFDMIKKLKSDSPELELLGDCPGSTKGFVYIDDVIRAFMLVGLEHNNDFFTANVCQSDEISVAEFALIVMRAMNIHKPIKWLGAGANWKNDNNLLAGTSDKLWYLGWRPKYPTSKLAIEQAVKDILKENL